MNIRIISDSASDISAPVQGLTVLPMTISFGNESYLDGVTLSHREFYEKLIEGEVLPKTSMIPPYDFERAIREALDAGEVPIIVTMSAKLSGTHQSAVLAAQAFEGVQVVDSENVCIGQRILVEYALRLVAEGMDAPAIVQELEEKKKKVCVLALLNTLEYLRRGGRISAAAGMVGGMLSIKPVVAIEGGEVVVVGKARGSRNGNNLLTEKIQAANGVDFSMPFALAYSGFDDTMLKKYVADNAHLWKDEVENLPVATVGGTIGTYAGPGAVAVAFFRP